jgi:hypothetical protein
MEQRDGKRNLKQFPKNGFQIVKVGAKTRKTD